MERQLPERLAQIVVIRIGRFIEDGEGHVTVCLQLDSTYYQATVVSAKRPEFSSSGATMSPQPTAT